MLTRRRSSLRSAARVEIAPLWKPSCSSFDIGGCACCVSAIFVERMGLYKCDDITLYFWLTASFSVISL